MPARNVPLTLFPSTAVAGVTKSATDAARYGSALRINDRLDRPLQSLEALLSVTAIAAEVGDKLDVAIQTTLDDSNWVDVVAFTQVLGNVTAPVLYYAKIDAGLALSMFEVATALAAGAVRNLIGSQLRVKYVTTNDADDPVDTAFTFGVTVVLL